MFPKKNDMVESEDKNNPQGKEMKDMNKLQSRPNIYIDPTQ